MLTIHSPVALEDLRQALAPHGQCDRALWMLTRHTAWSLGPSYAIRDEQGRTVVIGGFCHNSEHIREVWAEITPLAARRVGELVRAARLTLAAQCQHDPRPVIVLARTRAGAAIARRLGMKPIKAGIYRWRAQWAE